MLGLVLLVVHQAAPAPWVVLSRRQGVAQPAAAAQLATVRDALVVGPDIASQAVGDLSKCQRKLPCLVKEARARGATLLVTVESARVVDEAVVKVDLLLVEEDGRKVESFVAEGPSATILEVLGEKTRAVMAPAVRRAAGIPDPVVAPVPAPPPVTPPAPVASAAPPLVIAPAPPPANAGGSFVRWVPGLVGVAAAGAGVGTFLSAASERDRLSAGGLLSSEVRPLVEAGKLKETLGLGLMVGGGAAVVTSLIWVLAAPSAPATVTVAPNASGGTLVVGGTFP